MKVILEQCLLLDTYVEGDDLQEVGQANGRLQRHLRTHGLEIEGKQYEVTVASQGMAVRMPTGQQSIHLTLKASRKIDYTWIAKEPDTIEYRVSWDSARVRVRDGIYAGTIMGAGPPGTVRVHWDCNQDDTWEAVAIKSLVMDASGLPLENSEKEQPTALASIRCVGCGRSGQVAWVATGQKHKCPKCEAEAVEQ